MQKSSGVGKPMGACAICRDRKVKCDGHLPCRNCVRQKKNCHFQPSRRGKRSIDGTFQQFEFVRQGPETVKFRVEAPSRPAESRARLPLPPLTQRKSDYMDASRPDLFQGLVNTAQEPSLISNNDGSRLADIPPVSGLQRNPLGLTSPARTHSPVSQLLDSVLPSLELNQSSNDVDSDDAGEAGGDVDENLIPPHWVNWEHHGPWSWASVCSQSGLSWVCKTTGSNDFVEIGCGLTKTWSRRLKTTRSESFTAKCPELDEPTAWKFVAAYFEHSYDAVFGIVHRPSFESRLRAHFAQTKTSDSNDSSWFALRNSIYALGCRSLLAYDQSLDFVAAEAQARKYFQNALSVFSDLIFGHSGLTAVQALALMTFYAEGLGNPALEYPLCTTAVHLAQAKGLHRGHSVSWGLSEAEIMIRSWLWWAIYCLEKQICFRGGRPSGIDDDDISTQIPTKAPPGSTIDVEIFTLIIKHAQISAQITTRIMSVKAFKQTRGQAIRTVRDISQQLESLLNSISPTLKVNNLVHNNRALTPRQVHIIYLHFAIYGSIMATNIIFFYPWISVRFESASSPAFQQQLVRSSRAVADAARQIIVVLKSLTVNVAVPAWLAFYYPMYAHINMFIYVLRYPLANTVNGDLAMLDMGAGHFGHVEHVTLSEVSFHFPRESSALCAKAVKVTRGKEASSATVPGTPQAEAIGEDYPLAGPDSTLEPFDSLPSAVASDFDGFQEPNLDWMDLDMAAWNIYSSVDGLDSFAPNFNPNP